MIKYLLGLFSRNYSKNFLNNVKFEGSAIIIFSFLVFSFWQFSCAKALPNEIEAPESIVEKVDTIFGFPDNQYWIEERMIKPDQFMTSFLQDFGVDYEKILQLEKLAESTFSLRKIKAGKSMTCIKDEECDNPAIFVYQPDLYQYIIYDLSDSVYTEQCIIPHHSCLESASGVVITSLWNAMRNQGMNVELIDKMEDALATFDFTMSQVGDEFKLVYDQEYIDDQPSRTGILHAAYYKTGNTELKGVYFENKKYQGFYDEKGRPTKRAFLKAPIRARYRISSVYNLRRFHPIDRKVKPHLGTDYAADYGTPIRSVADGKVVIAGYTKGNGRYVKIRHNKTYQTQYLHMQGFARGIRSGSYVRQGQTIGYVGSTGKATGPHVCFRFWKNGRQINHRRENFPPLDPMPKDQLPEFFEKRDVLDEFLNQIDIIPFEDPDDIVI